MANRRKEINDFVKVMLAVMKNNRDADFHQLRTKYYQTLINRQNLALGEAKKNAARTDEYFGGAANAKNLEAMRLGDASATEKAILRTIYKREAANDFGAVNYRAVRAGLPKSVDTNNMTLGQVFAYQDKMLAAQKGDRSRSSAFGPGQTIKSTLARWAKGAGVSTDTKMTADVWNKINLFGVRETLKQAGGDVSKVPLVWMTGNAAGKTSHYTPAKVRAYQRDWMNELKKQSSIVAKGDADKPAAGAKEVSSDSRAPNTPEGYYIPGRGGPEGIDPILNNLSTARPQRPVSRTPNTPSPTDAGPIPPARSEQRAIPDVRSKNFDTVEEQPADMYDRRYWGSAPEVPVQGRPEAINPAINNLPTRKLYGNPPKEKAVPADYEYDPKYWGGAPEQPYRDPNVIDPKLNNLERRDPNTTDLAEATRRRNEALKYTIRERELARTEAGIDLDDNGVIPYGADYEATVRKPNPPGAAAVREKRDEAVRKSNLKKLEDGITGDDNGDNDDDIGDDNADLKAFDKYVPKKKKTTRSSTRSSSTRSSSTRTAGKPTQLAGAVGKGDYQSNSRRVINPDGSLNWGTDEAGYDNEDNPGGNASDFFRADRELMRRSKATDKATSAIPGDRTTGSSGGDTDNTGDTDTEPTLGTAAFNPEADDWGAEYENFTADDNFDPGWDAGAGDWFYHGGAVTKRYEDGGPVESALPMDDAGYGADGDFGGSAAEFFRNDPYRTGGQNVSPPEVPAGESVVAPDIGGMIGSGLKYLQSVFGLNQSGAIPTASSGGKAKEMMSGAGKLSEAEASALARVADPKGQMPREIATLAGLKYMYDYHLDRGDMRGAASIAGSMIQRAQGLAIKYGTIAEDAIKKGDMTTAIRALKEAHDAIPDGKRIVSTQGGVALVDDRTGQTVQKIRVTPQVILDAALGLKGGGMYKLLVDTAATATTRGTRKTADKGITAAKPLTKSYTDLKDTYKTETESYFAKPEVGKGGVGAGAENRAYNDAKVLQGEAREKFMSGFTDVAIGIARNSGFKDNPKVLYRAVDSMVMNPQSPFVMKEGEKNMTDKAGNLLVSYQGHTLTLTRPVVAQITRLREQLAAARKAAAKAAEDEKKQATAIPGNPYPMLSGAGYSTPGAPITEYPTSGG